MCASEEHLNSKPMPTGALKDPKYRHIVFQRNSDAYLRRKKKPIDNSRYRRSWNTFTNE